MYNTGHRSSSFVLRKTKPPKKGANHTTCLALAKMIRTRERERERELKEVGRWSSLNPLNIIILFFLLLLFFYSFFTFSFSKTMGKKKEKEEKKKGGGGKEEGNFWSICIFGGGSRKLFCHC